MIKHALLAVAAAGLCVLAGCSEKKTEATAAETPKRPDASATAEQVKTAAATAAKEAAAEVKKQADEVFANFSQQLLAKSAQADSTLKSLSTDLQNSLQKLSTSLQGNEVIKTQVNTAAQALLGNRDLDAIKAFDQLSAAKLTPEQLTIAKEVYQVGAAYVTQKNFSSLPDAQSEVAQIVNGLRTGNYVAVAAPLQTLSQKANLTPAQKDLVAAFADKYAPGVKAAAGKIQTGLDTLKKFGK